MKEVRSELMARYIAPGSRRHFLQIAGRAGVVAAAAPLVSAQTGAPATTDIDVLNYALTLEFLEATFYSQFLGAANAGGPNSGLIGTVTGNPPAFVMADALNSTRLSGVGVGVNNTLFSFLQAIRDHEVAHAGALRMTIMSLGGTPVRPCSYTFPVTSFDSFLQTAQALENTGVSAYDGAINRIKDPALVQTGATIATVEARHAAFLNLVVGGAFSMSGIPGGQPGPAGPIPGVSASPFPSAFDTPLSMQQVLAIANPFLASCPTPLPQGTAVATITPNNTTVNQASVNLSAVLSPSVSSPATVQFQIAPGGKIPAILQQPNSRQATVQFVNGPGTYLLQLSVIDAAGMSFLMPITLTYQP